MKRIINKVKNETVFLTATILALVSCFFIAPKKEYIDTHVLMILFNLMIVVELYRKENFLDFIAIKFLNNYQNKRIVSGILILLVFFFSMFLTNDVALITFIPLTIIVGKKANFHTMKIVVLETIAANLGSALTPMGNPQNLFIFSKYSLNIREFLLVTTPLAVLGLIILLVINRVYTSSKDLEFSLDTPELTVNTNLLVSSFIFLGVLFSILFHIPIFIITIFTGGYLIFRKENSFFKIDWILLLTFVSFFIFVGNLSNLSEIREPMERIMANKKTLFFSSILFSQVISNVPAAILISEFTNNWKTLLIGVNLGGLGTLVASLASLISFKIYVNEYPEEKSNYLKFFTILNFSILLFMVLIFM